MDSPTKSEHPSLFALTSFHAGEADEPARVSIESHLADCADCRQALAGLEKVREEFDHNHDRAAFLSSVRVRAEQEEEKKADDEASGLLGFLIRPVFVKALAGSAAFLLILVLLLVVDFGNSGSGIPGPEKERIKGAEFELSYLVMEQGKPVVARAERILHPGDRIQFRLTGTPGGFLHLVGIDESGQVSVYFYPGLYDASEPFPGGSGRPVPGSVVLDKTLGKERVFALICKKPMQSDALLASIRRLSDDPRSLLDSEQLQLECRQTSLMLVKE